MKAYQAAFELAIEIFEVSSNKCQYPKSYVSKLIEADGEATETQVWLDFSNRFGYLTHRKHEELIQRREEIGRMLGRMIKHPEKFLPGNQSQKLHTKN